MLRKTSNIEVLRIVLSAKRLAWWRGVLAACLLGLPLLAHANAAPEKRLALVVGNARYPTMPLDNPEHDARLVGATLKQLGFEVSEHVNLNVREFRRVLRDFTRRVQDEEGVAVLYYAGHGVQIGGRNYLLPVDVNLRDEEEVKDDAVDIDEVFVSRIERARTPVRIVILDACRDNPFKKMRQLRPIAGLAEMTARGTLIAYSSAPGAPAADGPPGTNSIYTRHLAREMLVEGLEIEQMFKNVRVKVIRDTQERQVPWDNSSLTVRFSFNPTRSIARDEGARQTEIQALRERIDVMTREQQQLEKRLAESQIAATRPVAIALPPVVPTPVAPTLAPKAPTATLPAASPLVVPHVLATVPTVTAAPPPRPARVEPTEPSRIELPLVTAKRSIAPRERCIEQLVEFQLGEPNAPRECFKRPKE